ncbi:glycosyltransferase family 32 protein [Nitratireductor sp. ZSWI3]|uniref:glycosyltransferase family 32 protein n=1 Tax=Nitratireductor sp. ZSWI3 TaxID=2966359 RepID=UPI00214F6B63|nr:glycosyltransferase [Nitratireductor sp. ZSWI3]MCR4265983.1 hypothetical protein [Nitratireductor sp. ZSWI3]
MHFQRIFQILISDRPAAEAPRSDALERNIASFRQTYPEASHHIYGDEELQDFLSESFGSEVLAAYRVMRPYAYKADLARYCLLMKFGGLYSDLSYMHVRRIEPRSRSKMVVFRDIPGHPSWSVSNAIIFAKPGSSVLDRAIQRVLAHCKSGHYGVSPLDPTGPYMFGRILAETDDWRAIEFGDSSRLNVDATGRTNIVKIMPGGEVVAIRNKTRDGTISDLVPNSGNNYNKLWRDRCVWGESSSRTLANKVRRKLGI